MPNAAKTKILPAAELDGTFHFRENTWLSRIENKVKLAGRTGRNRALLCARIRQRFARWIREKPAGNWTKVLKRYYTFFGYLRDPGLVGRSRRDLAEYPELTDHTLRYYRAVGFSERILQGVERYLDSGDNIHEDMEIKILEFLCDWQVPNRSRIRSRIAARALARFDSSSRKAPQDVVRAICVMLLAKYGTLTEQRNLQRRFLGGGELNSLVKEYIVAFSPCLNPVSQRYRDFLLFAAGESTEAISRIVHLWRSMNSWRSWPREIKAALQCARTEVPPTSSLPMRRLPLLYASCTNPRLRKETRDMVSQLIKKNEDPVIGAHLERVRTFLR